MSTIRHFQSVADGLEAEDALLSEVVSGSKVAAHLVWDTTQSLVAPHRFAKLPSFENARSDLASRGWPLSLRMTGGDVTPQGPGILNIAFATSVCRLPSTAESYKLICDPIIAALGLEGCATCAPVAHAFCDGTYNIVVNGRKLAGTAQRRTRMRDGSGRVVIFVHALLLCAIDIADSVDAINAFSAALGQHADVRASAHIDLASIVGFFGSDLNTIANCLDETFGGGGGIPDFQQSHLRLDLAA